MHALLSPLYRLTYLGLKTGTERKSIIKALNAISQIISGAFPGYPNESTGCSSFLEASS